MKTKTNLGFDDVIIGAEKEMAFEIDGDNSVIFDILRNKMYSNPIGAICREVTCNARDANREVGRGDIPIDIIISVPDDSLTQTTECITINDYGPGISPSRMQDVFIKYGSSTKRSTNAQTGGWGLGAKTPFAYADAFTIITRCKNEEGKIIRYEYSAIIDSSDKGKMILFDEQEMTEEDAMTGTSIIIPVSPSDVDSFKETIIQVTQLWPVKPNLKGFDNHSYIDYDVLYSVYDEDEIKCEVVDFAKLASYQKAEHFNIHSDQDIILNLDGVNYILNQQYFKSELLDKYYDLKKIFGTENQTFILYFETGELQPSANREELQYDEDTRKAISERLDFIINKISKDAEARLKKAKNSLLELLKFYYLERNDTQSFISYCAKVMVKAEFILKGNKLTKGIKSFEQLRTYQHRLTVVRYDERKQKIVYENGNTIASSSPLLYQKVIYRDKGRRDARRNLTILNSLSNNQEDVVSGKVGFILIEPLERSAKNEEQRIENEDLLYRERVYLANKWELDIDFYDSYEKTVTKTENSPIKTVNYAKKKVVQVSAQILTKESLERELKRPRWRESEFCYADSIFINKDLGLFYSDEQSALDQEDDDLLHPQDSVYIQVDSTRIQEYLPYEVRTLSSVIFNKTKYEQIILLTKTSVDRYSDRYTAASDIANDALKDGLIDLAHTIGICKVAQSMPGRYEGVHTRQSILESINKIVPLRIKSIIKPFINDSSLFDKNREAEEQYSLLSEDQRNQIKEIIDYYKSQSDYVTTYFTKDLPQQDNIAHALIRGRDLKALDRYVSLRNQRNTSKKGRMSRREGICSRISQQSKIK